MHTRTQGKKWWFHKRLGQTYLLVLEDLLRRRGVAGAHCRDKNTGSGSSGVYSLAWALLEAAIFSPTPGLTQQPVDSSAGTPQPKKPTGQEHSPSHQQTGYLKSSWTQSCLVNIPHDTALPTRGTKPSSTHQWAGTRPSHQEACTNLLASAIRGQTAEARTTTLQPVEVKPQSQKVRQNEMVEEYVTYEGKR